MEAEVRFLSLLLCGVIGCGARSSLSERGPAGAAGCDVPERTGAPKPVVVQAVNDLGALGQPSSVSFRDGGSSARIGDRVLWTFADTLLKAPAADGQSFRSSTAAYARPDGDLLALTDNLDESGAPLQLLPFTAEEQAFNDAGSGDDRWALWPFATLDRCGGGALVFYSKVRIKPGFLNFETVSSGVARLAPPSTVADRAPDFLWNEPDKMFVLGGLRDGGFVYFYACQPVPMTLDQLCQVARAPFADVDQRSAYAFWDGAGWNAEIQSAVPVFHGAPGDASVSWNAHLDAFIAVHSGVLSTEIVIQTAPRPEGPWSAPVLLLNGAAPGPGEMSFDYAAKEHPELSPDGGKTLVITYAHPLGGLDGELRVVEVVLE